MTSQQPRRYIFSFCFLRVTHFFGRVQKQQKKKKKKKTFSTQNIIKFRPAVPMIIASQGQLLFYFNFFKQSQK